jgi:hypothetical protein
MEPSWIWSAVLVVQTVVVLVTVILLWDGRRMARRLLRERHERDPPDHTDDTNEETMFHRSVPWHRTRHTVRRGSGPTGGVDGGASEDDDAWPG